MKLSVLPEEGIEPILSAIKKARKSLDIAIFRLDMVEVAKALRTAVSRGVAVRTLIAHTNSGGEKRLRKLESELLDTGAIVARTDADLPRYHGKMMIVDRSKLFVLGFNYTALDVKRSRSFGIMTQKRELVQEALKLFEADSLRQPYLCGTKNFVVSPLNSRERLAAFLRGARKQILIYDPKVADPGMIRILQERARLGVDVRVIGKLGKRGIGLKGERLPGRRLHVRAIVRDGQQAFLGSQSLRKLELDGRREIGVIFKDRQAVSRIAATFEDDWSRTTQARKDAKKAAKEAKKAAKKANQAA